MIISTSTYFPSPPEGKSQITTCTLFIYFYKAYEASREYSVIQEPSWRETTPYCLLFMLLTFAPTYTSTHIKPPKCHHLWERPWLSARSMQEFSTGNRNYTRLPNAIPTWSVRRFPCPCISRQHFCIKYPHRTVRCMGEKESDSHHTGLAPEQLLFILKEYLPLHHSFRHSANTCFSIHNLKHYFWHHNCSHPFINVLYFFKPSLWSLREEFQPLSRYHKNPYIHWNSGIDKSQTGPESGQSIHFGKYLRTGFWNFHFHKYWYSKPSACP